MKYRHTFHRKWRWQRVTQIMARDGLFCAICGLILSRAVKDPESPDYITFDHIVPTSRGGLSVVEPEIGASVLQYGPRKRTSNRG